MNDQQAARYGELNYKFDVQGYFDDAEEFHEFEKLSHLYRNVSFVDETKFAHLEEVATGSYRDLNLFDKVHSLLHVYFNPDEYTDQDSSEVQDMYRVVMIHDSYGKIIPERVELAKKLRKAKMFRNVAKMEGYEKEFYRYAAEYNKLAKEYDNMLSASRKSVDNNQDTSE